MGKLSQVLSKRPQLYCREALVVSNKLVYCVISLLTLRKLSRGTALALLAMKFNVKRSRTVRGEKHYSNVSFTRRVDHDAGRHKTSRAPSEPAKCEECGAIYSDRRWTSSSAGSDEAKHNEWRPARRVVCPACRQQREGTPRGVLYIEGTFVHTHQSEIETLLDSEAERAAADNPLARIMSWTEEDGQLTVTTTTEHLAQRLGHALEDAYSGEVHYDFSHENKLTRVYWSRDSSPS